MTISEPSKCVLWAQCAANGVMFVSHQTSFLDMKVVLDLRSNALPKTDYTLLIQFFMAIAEPSKCVLWAQCVVNSVMFVSPNKLVHVRYES